MALIAFLIKLLPEKIWFLFIDFEVMLLKTNWNTFSPNFVLKEFVGHLDWSIWQTSDLILICLTQIDDEINENNAQVTHMHKSM